MVLFFLFFLLFFFYYGQSKLLQSDSDSNSDSDSDPKCTVIADAQADLSLRWAQRSFFLVLS